MFSLLRHRNHLSKYYRTCILHLPAPEAVKHPSLVRSPCIEAKLPQVNVDIISCSREPNQQIPSTRLLLVAKESATTATATTKKNNQALIRNDVRSNSNDSDNLNDIDIDVNVDVDVIERIHAWRLEYQRQPRLVSSHRMKIKPSEKEETEKVHWR
jgi:hypothetical protein